MNLSLIRSFTPKTIGWFEDVKILMEEEFFFMWINVLVS